MAYGETRITFPYVAKYALCNDIKTEDDVVNWISSVPLSGVLYFPLIASTKSQWENGHLTVISSNTQGEM
jgi:hypothetical protein